MKKWISALLALVMVLSLCACGGGNDKPSQTPSAEPSQSAAPAPAKNVDLKAFVEAERAKYGEDFNCGMELSDPANVEYLDMYFPGLKDLPAKQLVVCQPMMSFVVCEIAIAEAEDAAGAQAFKNAFQARIDGQVEGGAFYPESVEGWTNNSRVVENGNYVMMIVWEKCDDVVADFNALF